MAHISLRKGYLHIIALNDNFVIAQVETENSEQGYCMGSLCMLRSAARLFSYTG
ncbi:MAG: hypothetical protein ACTTH7_09235 [Treponema sp.]